MRKILLSIIALFLLGVGVANAKKYYADLSTGSAIGNATWTAGTNTFAWTAGSYAYMVVPGGSFSGDLSEYTTIGLTVSDLVNEFRVDILANGKTFTGKSIATGGNIVLDIFNDFNLQWNPDKITAEDLKTVTAIRLNTNSESGSAVVTKFFIAKPATLSFDDSGNAQLDFTDLVATGGLSFNEETGELTNDGTGGSLYVNMPTSGIDFTSMTAMTVNKTGDDVIDHLEIKDEANSISNGFWGSKYGVNFTVGDAMKFNSAPNVNSIVWYGNTTAGTLTISSIVFKANVITCTLPGTPVVLNTLQYHNFSDGTNATATWNINVETDTYYGSGSSSASNYVDLTEYEELRIHRANNTGFRAFFINADGTGTNNINNNTTGTVSWNETESYWVIDLSKVEKYNGKVYLNTIKSESWGVNNIVTNITVYKTPIDAPNYILAGSGSFTPGVVTALADANATYIDATGITAATELISANPNCMITANAGMVTNTSNVIVDGVCANLVLTDGYPFSAPADFTATAASYTTTINTSAKAGTLCLPFAAAIPEVVTAYTLSYTSGDAATVTPVDGTIPANTPVLLNGSGEQTFTGSSCAIDADADNVSGALKGVFAATTVPLNSYVLQNGTSGVGFYKVATSDITAKPFRAYLTAESAGAKEFLSFDFQETGIEEVKNGQMTNEVIYNLNGQRLNKLQKGVNIVNGHKVLVK